MNFKTASQKTLFALMSEISLYPVDDTTGTCVDPVFQRIDGTAIEPTNQHATRNGKLKSRIHEILGGVLFVDTWHKLVYAENKRHTLPTGIGLDAYDLLLRELSELCVYKFAELSTLLLIEKRFLAPSDYQATGFAKQAVGFMFPDHISATAQKNDLMKVKRDVLKFAYQESQQNAQKVSTVESNLPPPFPHTEQNVPTKRTDVFPGLSVGVKGTQSAQLSGFEAAAGIASAEVQAHGKSGLSQQNTQTTPISTSLHQPQVQIQQQVQRPAFEHNADFVSRFSFAKSSQNQQPSAPPITTTSRKFVHQPIPPKFGAGAGLGTGAGFGAGARFGAGAGLGAGAESGVGARFGAAAGFSAMPQRSTPSTTPINNECRVDKSRALQKTHDSDAINRETQNPFVLDFDRTDNQRKKTPDMKQQTSFAAFAGDLMQWWRSNSMVPEEGNELLTQETIQELDDILSVSDYDNIGDHLINAKGTAPLRSRMQAGPIPKAPVLRPAAQSSQVDTDNVNKLVDYCQNILKSINTTMIEQWHEKVQCDPDEGVGIFTDIICVILDHALLNTSLHDLWQITVQLRKMKLMIGNERNYQGPATGADVKMTRKRYMGLIDEGIADYIYRNGHPYFKTQDPGRPQGWNDYGSDDLDPLNYAKKLLNI